MNEAREIYLKHYSGADSLDHMIKNSGIKYITHRYWHSPYLYELSLAIIVSYNMYNECCDGGLDLIWKIDMKERLTFAEFRLRLSGQMLRYHTFENKNAGDKKFREFSQMTTKQRLNESPCSEERFSETGVTMDDDGSIL